MTLLLNLISKVPAAALYIVGDMFYLLNRYVIRYRYDVVRNNLRNAFPQKSETELAALREKIFRNLADLLVETIKVCIDTQNHDCMIFRNVVVRSLMGSGGIPRPSGTL